MKQTEQRWLPDLVLLGDNSRYVFLNWLCLRGKVPFREGQAIWAKYGTKFTLEYRNGTYYMETPKLLPQMTLCIPPEDDATGLDRKKDTRFAVFESDHFGQMRSRMHLNWLSSIKCETVVVLMDLPRLQASTDLLEPGADLSRAQKRYAEQGTATVTIQNSREICSVLHWRQPLTKAWLREMKDHLESLQDGVEELEIDYMSMQEDWNENPRSILAEETTFRLCSYQTARREGKGNLWDSFSVAAIRMVNSSEELSDAVGLYREKLDNPLVSWDVEDDVKQLKKSLEDKFCDQLLEKERHGHYREMTKLPTGFKREDFDRVAARADKDNGALVRIFRETINSFFSEKVLLALVRKRLNERCKRLKELIQ